jgi:hypothetical protein
MEFEALIAGKAFEAVRLKYTTDQWSFRCFCGSRN